MRRREVEGDSAFKVVCGIPYLLPAVSAVEEFYDLMRAMEESARSALARIASVLALRKSRNVRNTTELSVGRHAAIRSSTFYYVPIVDWHFYWDLYGGASRDRTIHPC
jgi:hypothetical protein